MCFYYCVSRDSVWFQESRLICRDRWDKDVVGLVEQSSSHGKNKISVSFVCETLKADKAAEDHISKFMPKLAGLDAVGNSSHLQNMKTISIYSVMIQNQYTWCCS